MFETGGTAMADRVVNKEQNHKPQRPPSEWSGFFQWWHYQRSQRDREPFTVRWLMEDIAVTHGLFPLPFVRVFSP